MAEVRDLPAALASCGGQPCPVNVHKCWKAISVSWSDHRTQCNIPVDPDSIGLCPEHLAELQVDTGPAERDADPVSDADTRRQGCETQGPLPGDEEWLAAVGLIPVDPEAFMRSWLTSWD